MPQPNPEPAAGESNAREELGELAPAYVSSGESVDALDVLIVLGRHRRQLALWPVLAAVVAAGVSLVIPQTFTGVTKILPPQQAQSSAAALMSQLGGLANAAGSAFGIKNQSDLYIAMLQSNAVADALIERFELKKRYRKTLQMDARIALADHSRFTADKSGLIVIEVDAREPKLAAEIANAYVEEFHSLTSTLAVSEAAQRRVFFERQLQQAKDKLADAEVTLRGAIDAGGLVSVDAQSRATFETVARLRAQISAKEIQNGAVRAYATASNPELRRAEQELASMRQELARLETGAGAGDEPEDGRAGKRPPARGVGNIRLLREVKYREVMFELLAKQYELARVDESKEAPIVQVMDRAEAPERRTSPKRAKMVIVSAAAAFMGAVLAAFVLEAWGASRNLAARQAKLVTLRSLWLGRRKSGRSA